MRFATAITLVVTATLLPVGLNALDFRGGDTTIVLLPINDDLYASGGKVLIDESVTGDVMVAAGSLIIGGSVGQDLHAAGGSVVVNAPVGDDLRAAGGDITLTSRVGGDLVVFGGSVTLTSGAVVEGDVVVGSGSLILAGTVQGDLRASSGTVDFSGTIGGKARFEGADELRLGGRVAGDTTFSSDRALVGPGARFGGDVAYWLEGGEMEFAPGIVAGEARFDPSLKKRTPVVPMVREKPAAVAGGLFGAFFAFTFLSGVVVLILLGIIFPRPFRRAGEVLHREFWKSTGVGFLSFLALPAAAILAMVTVVGMPVGALLLSVFAFAVMFSRVVAALVLARWIERRRYREWGRGGLLLAAVGLYLVIKLVGIIPFIGWLAVGLLVLASYGALLGPLWAGD